MAVICQVLDTPDGQYRVKAAFNERQSSPIKMNEFALAGLRPLARVSTHLPTDFQTNDVLGQTDSQGEEPSGTAAEIQQDGILDVQDFAQPSSAVSIYRFLRPRQSLGSITAVIGPPRWASLSQ